MVKDVGLKMTIVLGGGGTKIDFLHISEMLLQSSMKLIER